MRFEPSANAPEGGADVHEVNRQLVEANERLKATNEVLIAHAELLIEQQDELRVAYEELKRLNAIKDEFLSIVSHELRTPLTAVRNTLSILKKRTAGPLNDVQARFLRIAAEHTAHLGRLVDDLLDLQKLAHGGLELRFQVADVRPLIESTVVSFSPTLEQKGLRLAMALGPSPLFARVDPDRLAQVLLNLLSNAAKFTAEGGLVTVEARQEGPEVLIAITDTGTGIHLADLERIFEKFVQVEKGLERQVAGTGLGLTICKQLIEEGHRGRIWATSTPGEGSTFTIALPPCPPSSCAACA